MEQDWTSKAACHGSEVDFYAIDDEGNITRAAYDKAVKVCGRCPVARECATFAMRKGDVERYGIWAGSLPRRRIWLAKQPIADAVQTLLEDLAKNYGDAVKRQRNRGERIVRADIIHGIDGYKNHGCPCGVCKGAWKTYQEKRKAGAA